jgi:hypothetical protein
MLRKLITLGSIARELVMLIANNSLVCPVGLSLQVGAWGRV